MSTHRTRTSAAANDADLTPQVLAVWLSAFRDCFTAPAWNHVLVLVAGAVLAPRLLAAFGSQRERYRTASELQNLSGIAPVREQSGRTAWIHFRRSCPKFLRQTFHEWAGHSIAFSSWARAYYQLQRARGKDHHAAVRALAFKWIRIVFRCWQDRVLYDEQRYAASLVKRNSPLSPLSL